MRARLPLFVIFGLLITLLTQSSYANELLIWDKLQGSAPKGYVLLLRHTLAPGVGDPENFKLNDCATQRNLSEVGRQDAKEVGEWLKRREIRIFRVESSRWCRAKETAQLLNLGKVKLNKNLDSLFEESDIANHPATKQVRKRILNHRNKVGLLILVGHYVNIGALTGVGVDSGEGVLVKADSKGVLKAFGLTPKLGN
ncbi:MAG TPA: histidine phosphatase family protein [Actinobacteria bacterium]|jgi:phosphohistidine phosphatase SixA|nr:histidine phosphatase family protein [Actinomycetota bacterium]